uniref:Peptidase_M16_C domain-containing protein n=1 Tax=Steinernema glaseri TaxID=37863 RepID=A0A1I8A2Z4_9BILA
MLIKQAACNVTHATLSELARPVSGKPRSKSWSNSPPRVLLPDRAQNYFGNTTEQDEKILDELAPQLAGQDLYSAIDIINTKSNNFGYRIQAYNREVWNRIDKMSDVSNEFLTDLVVNMQNQSLTDLFYAPNGPIIIAARALPEEAKAEICRNFPILKLFLEDDTLMRQSSSGKESASFELWEENRDHGDWMDFRHANVTSTQ